MSDGDTPVTGPQTLLEAVDRLFPDRPAEATPEPETETESAGEAPEAQTADAEDADAGTEAPETDAPEAAPEEPQVLDLDTYGDVTVAVTVDGQEQRVNLAELAKGYHRQADYTRKAQALAEQRKEIEGARGKLEAEYAERERQLLARFAEQAEPEPDWLKMAREDPLGYVERRAEWDAKAARRKQAADELSARQRKAMEDAARANLEKLVERRPEWRNPETARAVQAEMLDGGSKYYGFTPDEVAATLDYRLVELLHDGIQYRKLKEANPADKKLAKAPKVIKPGSAMDKPAREAEKAAAAKRKLAKPHSIQEHLEALGIA